MNIFIQNTSSETLSVYQSNCLGLWKISFLFLSFPSMNSFGETKWCTSKNSDKNYVVNSILTIIKFSRHVLITTFFFKIKKSKKENTLRKMWSGCSFCIDHGYKNTDLFFHIDSAWDIEQACIEHDFLIPTMFYSYWPCYSHSDHVLFILTMFSSYWQ